jgi:hypothetical protein
MEGIWLAPLTPVDKAAYIHDWEYGQIYARYNYSEFEYGLSLASYFDQTFGTRLSDNPEIVSAFGWMGSHISLDPSMQMELAWADTRLITGSWGYLGEGLFKGFYSGGRGQRALITDLAWASAITTFYGAIVFWRIAMARIDLVYQTARGFANLFKSLGDRIGGEALRASPKSVSCPSSLAWPTSTLNPSTAELRRTGGTMPACTQNRERFGRPSWGYGWRLATVQGDSVNHPR